MIVSLERIDRALDVFKDGRSVTIDKDWCEVCETACIALNRLKIELSEETDALQSKSEPLSRLP